MYTFDKLHSESHQHGEYYIEHHGAGVHGLYFKTTRQRKFQYIGTFNGVEAAKCGIIYHIKTGYSKPSSIGSHINPESKWLIKK